MILILAEGKQFLAVDHGHEGSGARLEELEVDGVFQECLTEDLDCFTHGQSLAFLPALRGHSLALNEDLPGQNGHHVHGLFL